MEVRSGLRQFMRSESLSVLREILEKIVVEKLLVLEFLVRAFALVGDVESCLALRYEALLLRDLKSTTNPWLQVPYTEWLNFAQQSRDSGFYSVAGREEDLFIMTYGLPLNGDGDEKCLSMLNAVKEIISHQLRACKAPSSKTRVL